MTTVLPDSSLLHKACSVLPSVVATLSGLDPFTDVTAEQGDEFRFVQCEHVGQFE